MAIMYLEIYKIENFLKLQTNVNLKYDARQTAGWKNSTNSDTCVNNQSGSEMNPN